jgi:hypothetical protein
MGFNLRPYLASRALPLRGAQEVGTEKSQLIKFVEKFLFKSACKTSHLSDWRTDHVNLWRPTSSLNSLSVSPKWSRKRALPMSKARNWHLMFMTAQMTAIAKSTKSSRGLAYLSLEIE